MSILVLQNGAQLGPFSEEQLFGMVAEGKCQQSDLAWREGMPEWRPLSELFPSLLNRPHVAVPPPFSSTTSAAQPPQVQKRKFGAARIAWIAVAVLGATGTALGMRGAAIYERDAPPFVATQATNPGLSTASQQATNFDSTQGRDHQTGASPSHAQAKPVCNDCGIVQSIVQIKNPGSGSGTGAVVGGVVGGLLGSQVGKGHGKDAATVLGAIGGAVAGNQIEKSAKAETHYEMVVRLDNGSIRKIKVSAQPSIRQGDRVRINKHGVVPAS